MWDYILFIILFLHSFSKYLFSPYCESDAQDTDLNKTDIVSELMRKFSREDMLKKKNLEDLWFCNGQIKRFYLILLSGITQKQQKEKMKCIYSIF